MSISPIGFLKEDRQWQLILALPISQVIPDQPASQLPKHKPTPSQLLFTQCPIQVLVHVWSSSLHSKQTNINIMNVDRINFILYLLHTSTYP